MIKRCTFSKAEMKSFFSASLKFDFQDKMRGIFTNLGEYMTMYKERQLKIGKGILERQKTVLTEGKHPIIIDNPFDKMDPEREILD